MSHELSIKNPLPSSPYGRRVLIIGANFAGLSAALRLPRNYNVTVVDPSPHFEFLPNIHELVSSVKKPRHLRFSRERLLRSRGHRFVCQAVTQLDPANGLAQTTAGERLPFDACIVALGGVNNPQGIQGADTHAMPFRSVDHCAAISRRLAELIATQKKVSVVIVGGGIEGIEALGEILRRYRHDLGLSVYMVEKNARLMPQTPPMLDKEIRRLCQPYPVHFFTQTKAVHLLEDSVQLSSDEILPADLTLWTVGATAPSFLHQWGLAASPHSWAPVRPTLQSLSHSSIFIAGDAADLPQALGKQAYNAMDMGDLAAENIHHLFSNQPLKPFKPLPHPSLIAFGDLDTFMVWGDRVVAGPALAAAKEGIFQFTMARFDAPLNPDGFMGLQERYWNSITKLALPTLGSLSKFFRLGNLRTL
jgi:NADH dehydrogenase